MHYIRQILFGLMGAALLAVSAYAYSSGPPNGYAGDPPRNRNCTNCHNSFGVNTGRGSLELPDLPDAYAPGETYRMTVELSDPNARRWGFEMTVLDEDNDEIGRLGIVNGQITQISRGSPDYLKHTRTGTFRNQNGGGEWEFEWTAPDENAGPVTFYIAGNAANNNGGTSGDRIYTNSFTFEAAGPELRELTLALDEGWNMISINVSPEEEYYDGDNPGPDVIAMTEQLRIDDDNHHVLLFKDEDGRFYAPGFDFINIPYWNLAEGYLVKVDEDVEAVWEGEPIPFDADVPIEEGWNIIAYYPTYRLDASAPDFPVLAPIIDHVILAKDGEGRFLAPGFEFSNMLPWRETEGYQVKVDEELVLNYPAEENRLNVRFPADGRDRRISSRGGENMSVLLTGIDGLKHSSGRSVAAFGHDDRVVGTGEVVDGRAGLAVWGDDPTTVAVDGLREDESFALKLLDAENGEYSDLTPISFLDGEELVYGTNEFVALQAGVAVSPPTTYSIGEPYPNPFNSTTKLSYSLPKAGAVRLTVYDHIGRRIATLADGARDAGQYTALWDARSIPSGVYVVRFEVGTFAGMRKVALVR